MPDKTAQGIDVSREEEKYLRRAFRRFALPYLIGLAALTWAVTTAASRGGVAPGESSAELAMANDKLSRIEQSLIELDSRVSKMGTDVDRAGKRMSALEAKPNSAPASDTASLERSLRDAMRRVADLEQRLGDGPSTAERIDALTTRLHRIESAARTAPMPAPAMPAPAPVPAAPAPDSVR
jgi:hypothetical protein